MRVRFSRPGYVMYAHPTVIGMGFLMVGNDIFKTRGFFFKFRQKMDSRIHQKSLMTSSPLWCKIRPAPIYLSGRKD